MSKWQANERVRTPSLRQVVDFHAPFIVSLSSANDVRHNRNVAYKVLKPTWRAKSR